MDMVAIIQEDIMQQGAEMVVEPNRTMTGINVPTSNTFKQNTGLVGELKRLLLLWRQQSSKTSRRCQVRIHSPWPPLILRSQKRSNQLIVLGVSVMGI
jgi:predicted secreted acid phosphatase